MSTLPAKRRRVAISVTAKKEICQRKLENPKATQSELSQFALDRFGLSIGRSTISDILRDSAKWMEEEDSNNMKKRTGYHEELVKGALVMVLQHSFQKPSGIGRDASGKRSRVWATSWRF